MSRKFVTIPKACPLCTAGLLPTHSHPACLSLQLLLGSSLCLQLCFSIWVSLALVILSSGHQILGNSKCVGFPLSVSLGHVESLKLDCRRVRSFYAEFSWSERQSTPVLPELCLTNSSGKSLGFFPGTCPIFSGWLLLPQYKLCCFFVCRSLNF